MYCAHCGFPCNVAVSVDGNPISDHLLCPSPSQVYHDAKCTRLVTAADLADAKAGGLDD